MLKAILLDIDGTLLDSTAVHAQTWSEACALFGYERPPSFFKPLIGLGAGSVLARVDPALTDEADPGKAIAAKRCEIFRANYLATLRATPGAKAFIERLHASGLRCVIASSTSATDLDALLDVVGIRHLIDVSTTADDAADAKPAPDIIAVALRFAKVAATEAIMVGDTPYDIDAARSAGVSTIALRCGGWSDGDLSGAVAIYDDPADLLRHLASSPIAISDAA